MTRLLASAAACLALALFAAPPSFAAPAWSQAAPVAMGDNCDGCKGKESKPAGDEKPATSSVRIEMGDSCDGCKGKESKPAGDEKPAAS
ncbi:MAG: hypothetical protein AAGE65_11375 [Planctomycetota bacterium]